MHLHPKKTYNLKLRSEVLTKAFLKASQLLDLKPIEITNLAGISPASWSRVVNHKRLIVADSKEAELVILFIRIYRSLDALFGGNTSRACEWLRAFNHHLNGVPLEMLQKTQGLVLVATYLDAMRGLT
ncbi:MAG: DUF2384 domain-containing protein [Proteobacteria bacterium]|nr:DUF2384 domain-containing protein [Pseudomonadota bacterium]